MQTDLELFLEDELEGCVPLISPGDVKGSICLGPERSTIPCVHVIGAMPGHVPTMHWLFLLCL